MEPRKAAAAEPLHLFPELIPAGHIVESNQMALAAVQTATEDRAKALGAYYTDSQVADFLVWWAIRTSRDTVLDPSFGGGVFLRSAGRRIRELCGNPRESIFGVELAEDVYSEISALLSREFEVEPSHLALSDFFHLVPDRIPRVTAVVGNPPFIRYQRFTGDARRRGLARAAEEGLKLSALTSSWLPFLVHSIRFIEPGGRLAMVIPFEIGHAAYARPALEHLARKFGTVTFLTFRQKLFPHLSEDTLLLLAEERKDSPAQARFLLRDLPHAGDLSGIESRDGRRFRGTRQLQTRRVISGEERLIESLIPRKSRDLYRELRESSAVKRLGDLADVGIGYVTGANSFFHLSPEDVRRWNIPARFLRPCVRRGRALAGLRLTAGDWNAMLAEGEAGYLLDLPSTGSLPEAVNRYLAHGIQAGVHATFKCSNRTPWYRVPHVHRPDAFLTYMSGAVPRLVANDAGVVAPNSLHVLRLHRPSSTTGDSLAALWQSSLTRLSVEIEGHALGGGMLKLEPTEAGQVLLPFLPQSAALEALAAEMDEVSRRQGPFGAVEIADQALLERGLGLDTRAIRLLTQAADTLRERRMSRSTNHERRG